MLHYSQAEMWGFWDYIILDFSLKTMRYIASQLISRDKDFVDALYIYRFEIMILLRVKAKSLLCYWAVIDLGIGMAQIARFFNF
jgi:hypothetical protein